MLVKFTCHWCNFYTNNKGDYSRHINTKKHINKLSLLENKQLTPLGHHLVAIGSPVSHHFEDIQIFNTKDEEMQLCKKNKRLRCQYCSRDFKFKQGLYRHIKFHCKKNKDEGLQEYVKLLNEKNTEMKKELTEKSDEIIKIQKQLDYLTKKLQIRNITSFQNNGLFINGNLTNTNTNNINFNLLNHHETDYTHLTDKDYLKCITDCNHCVKTLIEKVHFNKNKPENMNIYISSIKGNFIMVFRDNRWQVRNRKDQIDDLYEFNEIMIENWYRDYHEKYPHIIDSFKRYLKNKDEDDELILRVKQEILYLLYNQREIIIDNRRTSETNKLTDEIEATTISSNGLYDCLCD